ncbi:MAG: hypothetical protein JXQ75_08555 [Phycisphaerae bacterium]|nr:hypothetical protein [Phycisphaerae bacterium]
MTRKGRPITAWALVVILVCSSLAVGCEPTNFFRSNLNVNLVVPLGFAGTPGLLNPFGIVQAWINALLGADATGDDGGGSQSPTAAPSPPTSLDPSIGAILN